MQGFLCSLRRACLVECHNTPRPRCSTKHVITRHAQGAAAPQVRQTKLPPQFRRVLAFKMNWRCLSKVRHATTQVMKQTPTKVRRRKLWRPVACCGNEPNRPIIADLAVFNFSLVGGMGPPSNSGGGGLISVLGNYVGYVTHVRRCSIFPLGLRHVRQKMENDGNLRGCLVQCQLGVSASSARWRASRKG